MKKVISVICVVLVLFILVVGTVFAFLTVDEYKPEDVEKLEVIGASHTVLTKGDRIRVMTWNVGYGALGDNADFFMDGGKMVNTADTERVKQNLNGDIEEIEKISPDILMLQEIDRNSSRSHFIDEVDYLKDNSLEEVLSGKNVFANNFKVSFIPYPIPPIGKVDGGIAIFTDYDITDAKRIQLPCPFSWPLRIANLKRCLEVVRIPVEGSDKELVVVNLHLEAYDDGEGKIAQTNMLKDVLKSEFDKGNYIIAGGDFNQVFSNIDASKFPTLEGKWEAGAIDVSQFGDDLTFYADEDVPSCRSLDSVLKDAQSTDPKDFQYYIIDGFIVSSNIEVKDIFADDLGFVSSDHNPVVIDAVLK